MRRKSASTALMLCIWTGVAAVEARAQSPDATREAPAGGLIFVNDPVLSVEAAELTVSVDEIRASYVVRNSFGQPRTSMVAFPLPDIDAAVFSDQPMTVPAVESTNFVAATFVVDNAPVSAEIEQRVLALGLDIGRFLEAARVPFFPFSRGIEDRLARLAPVLQAEFGQRGIIRLDSSKPQPNWMLKSTAYWRQTFPPRQTVRLVVTYRPIVAAAKYSSDLIEHLRDSHCIDLSVETVLNQKVAAKGVNVGFRWLTYALTSGSAMLTQPIGRFRLLILTPSIDSVVATCRKGLRRLGPTTLELSQTDFSPDEDLSLLIID